MQPHQPGLPRGLAWVAIPVAIHFALLVRFWFDAPVLDDYDCILESMGKMAAAGSFPEWFGVVFSLQNEHRLAGTRLMPQVVAWVTGGIDFRVLMLLGTLFMLGAFALIWAEFKEEASGPIAAAAAFLLLQWSYNEALLMASASTAHLGVVFFSIGALHFALRPGRASAALCVAGGVAATYSQANGLFVLPLAAVACFLLGQRRRAFLFILVAAALWVLYFTGYSRPPNHPSVLKALEDPVKTFQLFLIIIGGVGPSLPISQLIGATLLLITGWAAWMGLWRKHPTVFLWIAFVLVSAATVAAARVGFGLFYGSRYSVNAALLMAMLAFSAYSLTRPWRPRYDLAALGAAAVLSFAITIVALPQMRERSFRGHLLVEVDPALFPGATGGRYAGVHHPGPEHGARILDMAARHKWYSPPRPVFAAPAVARIDTLPPGLSGLGVMDSVKAEGRTVRLHGWAGLAADVPGRTFKLHPAEGIETLRVERLEAREDVAVALGRPDALLTGFRIAADFANEDLAREAAERLCVFVDAPGQPLFRVDRSGTPCTPR